MVSVSAVISFLNETLYFVSNEPPLCLHASAQMLHGKPSKAKIKHAISSSNYPFLRAVWDSAKQSSSVVGLKRHGSLVDVVADGGLLWIKVSTIGEKRLLM